MPTRRDFHRVTVTATTAAAGLALPVVGWPTPAAAAARPGAATAVPTPDPAAPEPTVEESDTEIVVDNGVTRMVVAKANNGRLTSLQLRGQELLNGRGYYDINSAARGTTVPLPVGTTTYTARRGVGFVDVAVRIDPSRGTPFTIVRHYIMRAGEQGIHLATEFHHPGDLHGFRAEQHRFVLLANSGIFTHASVEDDPYGLRFRAEAAAMPTPADLRAAPEVMDATEDLAGLNSVYARRYYTKYDWAVYQKDHVLHGLYGNGYGVWAVLPNKEAFNGGPLRQDLTVHQTTGGPVVLVEPQATHYGSPALEVYGEWSKTFGPYFLYLNTGDDPVALRADAMRYARFSAHAEFYDQVALPGWTPTSERSSVSGRIRIRGSHNMAGAVAVLSDNRVDFQRTVLGYQYWSEVNVDGSFHLRNVRPGTYRLSVYKPGVWGEYARDDVVVSADCRLRLPEAVWEPPRNGRTVWQIGTPDRTSAEFRRGAEARQWGLVAKFPEDFPDGVAYVVGQSTTEDWNYVQHQRIDGVLAEPWRIRFDLDRAPRTGSTATLTIALAAWAMDTARPVPPEPSNLTVHVNDTTLVWTFQPDDARGATYRSSAAGFYLRREFRFDAAALRPGSNEIVLRINEDAPEVVGNQAAYDAIRLEID
ncbi:MAG TPA: polysaccharide lyase family protein [Micromonosporaceae bacterium]|nr:polysaccharide lyase family protein [Micromonosporaceae bacterium]